MLWVLLQRWFRYLPCMTDPLEQLAAATARPDRSASVAKLSYATKTGGGRRVAFGVAMTRMQLFRSGFWIGCGVACAFVAVTIAYLLVVFFLSIAGCSLLFFGAGAASSSKAPGGTSQYMNQR